MFDSDAHRAADAALVRRLRDLAIRYVDAEPETLFDAAGPVPGRRDALAWRRWGLVALRDHRPSA